MFEPQILVRPFIYIFNKQSALVREEVRAESNTDAFEQFVAVDNILGNIHHGVRRRSHIVNFAGSNFNSHLHVRQFRVNLLNRVLLFLRHIQHSLLLFLFLGIREEDKCDAAEDDEYKSKDVERQSC